MSRAEKRRAKREAEKEKKIYTVTATQLDGMIAEATRKARDEAMRGVERGAHQVILMSMAIPLNVLISDYWTKTARKKIPEFVKKCESLFEAWNNGNITMEEMQAYVKSEAGVELNAPGSIAVKCAKERDEKRERELKECRK